MGSREEEVNLRGGRSLIRARLGVPGRGKPGGDGVEVGRRFGQPRRVSVGPTPPPALPLAPSVQHAMVLVLQPEMVTICVGREAVAPACNER